MSLPLNLAQREKWMLQPNIFYSAEVYVYKLSHAKRECE